jgi:hypothetical protein
VGKEADERVNRTESKTMLGTQHIFSSQNGKNEKTGKKKALKSRDKKTKRKPSLQPDTMSTKWHNPVNSLFLKNKTFFRSLIIAIDAPCIRMR